MFMVKIHQVIAMIYVIFSIWKEKTSPIFLQFGPIIIRFFQISVSVIDA